MLGEHGAVTVAEPLHELGRCVDVREEQRHHSRRNWATAGILAALAASVKASGQYRRHGSNSA